MGKRAKGANFDTSEMSYHSVNRNPIQSMLSSNDEPAIPYYVNDEEEGDDVEESDEYDDEGNNIEKRLRRHIYIENMWEMEGTNKREPIKLCI